MLEAVKHEVAKNADRHKIFESSLANLVSQSTYTEDMHDLRSQIKSLSNELRITKSDLERYQNEESLKTNLRQSEWTTLEEKIRMIQSVSEASQSDLLNKLSEMERAQRQTQYELTSVSVKVETAALLQHDIRKLNSKYGEISTTIEDMKLGILKLKENSLFQKSEVSEIPEAQRCLSVPSHKSETTDTLPTSIDRGHAAVGNASLHDVHDDTELPDESPAAIAGNSIIERTEGSIGTSENGSPSQSSLESDTSDDEIIPVDGDFGSSVERHSTLDELEKCDDNEPLQENACLPGDDAEDVSAGVTTPIRANDVSKSDMNDNEEDHPSVSSMSEADGPETNYLRPHPAHHVDLSDDSFEDELIPADDPMALSEYRPTVTDTSVDSDDSSEDLLIPAEPLPEDREIEVYDDPGAEAGLTREAAFSKALESSQPPICVTEESTDDNRGQHFKLQTTPTIISDPHLPNLVVENSDEVLDFDDFSDDEIIPADREYSVHEDKRTDLDIGNGGVPSPPEPNVSPEINTAREKKSPVSLSSDIFADSHHDREARPLSPLSRRSLTSSPVPDLSLMTKALAPSALNSQSQLPPLQTSGLSIR